jgi:hypothetical protein
MSQSPAWVTHGCHRLPAFPAVDRDSTINSPSDSAGCKPVPGGRCRYGRYSRCDRPLAGPPWVGALQPPGTPTGEQATTGVEVQPRALTDGSSAGACSRQSRACKRAARRARKAERASGNRIIPAAYRRGRIPSAKQAFGVGLSHARRLRLPTPPPRPWCQAQGLDRASPPFLRASPACRLRLRC